MLNSVLDCGANGWLMIAGAVTTYGVVILGATALGKYLFFGNRPSAAAQ